MTISIDPGAGFCFGVRRAVQIAERNLAQKSRLAVLGQLIHNPKEVDRLKQHGLEILDQSAIEEASDLKKLLHHDRVLIRSHGISQALYQRLVSAGVNLVDATCPFVRRIQRLARLAAERDDQVIIVGKKEHPEIKGILGHCGQKGWVIESFSDLTQVNFQKSAILISQSTMARTFFQQVAAELKRKMARLVVFDTTCAHIARRFQQVQDFSRHQDVMFIVGGKNSSNTQLFHESAARMNKNSYIIENMIDIERRHWAGAKRIGISGGASTPYWQLVEIHDFLEYETRKG